MKKISIHQPEHLPWLGFIHKVMSVDEFVLLDNVQFEKNYFQNRNKIRTNNGWQWLTVPIKKFKLGQKINEIEISYNQNWQSRNINGIRENYSKSRYFGEYFPEFEEIYQSKFKFLKDLNIELIKFLLKSLKINSKLHISSKLLNNTGERGTSVILNISKKLKADIYLSGIFGKTYLNIPKFNQANIKVEFQNFKHPIYKQLYEPFIPEMSSIDLLFNYGPESLSIITKKY